MRGVWNLEIESELERGRGGKVHKKLLDEGSKPLEPFPVTGLGKTKLKPGRKKWGGTP